MYEVTFTEICGSIQENAKRKNIFGGPYASKPKKNIKLMNRRKKNIVPTIKNPIVSLICAFLTLGGPSGREFKKR